MRLIKANEGEYYEAKNHFNVWSAKKVYDTEGAGNLNISVSEFLPNGGAELLPSVKDRVYIVTGGTMDVLDEAGNRYSMAAGDMIFIPAGEKRAIEVTGTKACSIIVVIVKA